MPLTPDDPPAKSRLIIPGAETEPEERPRIILPPGMVRESADELPEYPRLRRLMIMPVRDGEREMLLVQDPMGIMTSQPVLGMDALAILQLLDGTVSLTDISAAVMQESKDLRVANMVRDFIAQLDELLMLESPRFERALDEARAQYHVLEIRPAALEGVSYPAARAELEVFLDAHFAAAEAMRAGQGQGAVADGATPRALLAPHLDPRREGALMARAFLELGPRPATPLRVVIFGTGHNLVGEFYALTRKHFQTPLGRATCDTAFVDRLAGALGADAYRGELAHRDEHSIEFEVLYLQHRLRDRPFTIVPILCGGFYHLLDDGRTPREEPGIEALIAAVRDAEAALGGTTVYVAGVDFSHVGPRFGDGKVTDEVKGAIREIDEAAIAAAASADADAWFRVIAEKDDATRICGYAPTYATLRCAAPGPGRTLGYAQSTENDTSLVSVAAMAWG
jgi:AmmeMemoRadiSam system protein B